MANMPVQSSNRVAKEFLIRCIVEEAQRERDPLSDTERNMLYFSETHWTLPNILEVNQAFEREYNEGEYENKIERLIRNFKARVDREDAASLEQWNHAVKTLESEDHYLLVMIHAADGDALLESTPSSRMLQLTLMGILAGIAALVITFAMLFIARK